MIDYLHANPVRRGLVARAEDWEWPSARWYAGLRPVKLQHASGARRHYHRPRYPSAFLTAALASLSSGLPHRFAVQTHAER